MTMRTLASPRPGKGIALPATNALFWPAAACALVLVLHLALALGRAINWDEFYHYSLIHQFSADKLTNPMLTMLARTYSWVLLIPGDNITQILAARIGMFVFTAGTAVATYFLARGLTSKPIALICALAWLSAGFVLQHATSVRTDTIAAALLMTSLAIMINSRLTLRDSVICAACAALAVLFTMKSVLYAPAFAGIAWLRWQEADRSWQATWRLALLPVLVGVCFALFYAVHAAFLPEAQGSASSASSAANKMFRLFEMPYWNHAVKAASTAPVFTLALVLLPFTLWQSKALSRDERIAIIGLVLPITTLLFYHNSAAYYYVFMLPPVAVACCVSFAFMTKRYSVMLISAVMALSALGMWALEDRGHLDKQRRIVAAADQIFDEPVAYFDFPAQLAHFPKANGFLTVWGNEAYLKGYGGSMSATMANTPVPLVLENNQALTAALQTREPVAAFLPVDLAMLRDTYINFWGIYWIAGEELSAGESRTVELRVPGEYTVRDGQIAIDGMLYLPGEVITLDRGIYDLAAFDTSARLIWGNRLEVPTMPPPEEPIWIEF